MARYIDADFVANGLREHLPPDDDEHREALDQLTYAISILQFAPTADVAPVIHAHWETDNYGYAILNEEGHTLYLAGVPCSRCHVTGQTNWNYCPNCGAKMDEEV